MRIFQPGGIDMGYKDEIFKMLKNITDERVLKYLYEFIKHFVEKYGGF